MTFTPASLRLLLYVLGATIFHDAFAHPAQEHCPFPRPGAPVPFCRLDFVSTTGETFEAPQYGRVMHQAGIGFDCHCDGIRSASGWQLDQCRGLARWVT